jgi:hypothetical protein
LNLIVLLCFYLKFVYESDYKSTDL